MLYRVTGLVVGLPAMPCWGLGSMTGIRNGMEWANAERPAVTLGGCRLAGVQCPVAHKLN